jgi:hypothetical protein
VAIRPPADAVVALRSLGRRFRGLFAGLGEDESPDDVAHRVGADGRAAVDHIVGATRTIVFLGRAVEQLLLEEDPVLHPAVADPAARTWEGERGGTVEDLLAELGWEADALADRVDHVPAADWGRAARVTGRDDTVTASAVLWDAVDSAVAELKAAERTLAEVRRRR